MMYILFITISRPAKQTVFVVISRPAKQTAFVASKEIVK